MTHPLPDIIDRLAGLSPGSTGAASRARRPLTKEGAQASWGALFASSDVEEFRRVERFALATFVSILHGQPQIAAFYGEKLEAEGEGARLRLAIEAAAAAGLTEGPYGHYPDGPLGGENKDGLLFRVAETERAQLGDRLSALLDHAHLLVFHPRDAKPQHLSVLLEAGWTTNSIVTASQLIAFLAFQIRLVAGLKVLDAA